LPENTLDLDHNINQKLLSILDHRLIYDIVSILFDELKEKKMENLLLEKIV
jgi:hypothetical protein